MLPLQKKEIHWKQTQPMENNRYTDSDRHINGKKIVGMTPFVSISLGALAFILFLTFTLIYYFTASEVILELYGVSIIFRLLLFTFVGALIIFLWARSLSKKIGRQVMALGMGKKNSQLIGEKYLFRELVEHSDTLEAHFQNASEIGVQELKSSAAVNEIKGSDIHNRSVELRIQEALFQKPFSKYENFEIISYPKLPKSPVESCLVTHSNSEYIDMLFIAFEQKKTSNFLEKHRIYERFLTLSSLENSIPFASIAHNLWQLIQKNRQAKPSVLLLRYDVKGDFSLLRAGSFRLYRIDYQGEVLRQNLGDDFFIALDSAEKPNIERVETSKGCSFLVLHDNLVSALENKGIRIEQIKMKTDGGIRQKLFQVLDVSKKNIEINDIPEEVITIFRNKKF